MINDSQNDQNVKPAIIKKPSSAFNNDPYNNRSGKSNNKPGFVNNSSKKMKSIAVPKFKGGSGGDR
jgi:hypothetical protein